VGVLADGESLSDVHTPFLWLQTLWSCAGLKLHARWCTVEGARALQWLYMHSLSSGGGGGGVCTQIHHLETSLSVDHVMTCLMTLFTYHFMHVTVT
jgi:hypothetical protein